MCNGLGGEASAGVTSLPLLFLKNRLMYAPVASRNKLTEWAKAWRKPLYPSCPFRHCFEKAAGLLDRVAWGWAKIRGKLDVIEQVAYDGFTVCYVLGESGQFGQGRRLHNPFGSLALGEDASFLPMGGKSSARFCMNLH